MHVGSTSDQVPPVNFSGRHHCGGCKKSFITIANRNRHCKGKPDYSICRIWYVEVRRPATAAQFASSVHQRMMGHFAGSEANSDLHLNGQTVAALEADISEGTDTQLEIVPRAAEHGDEESLAIRDLEGENRIGMDGTTVYNLFDPIVSMDEADIQIHHEDSDSDEAELGIDENVSDNDVPFHEAPIGPDDYEQDFEVDEQEEPDQEGSQPMFNHPPNSRVDFQQSTSCSISPLDEPDGGDITQHANAEARRNSSLFSKIAYSEYFEGAAQVFGKGSTFLDKFSKDRYTRERLHTGNIYYPFKGFKEWEYTNVLMRMHCSLEEKNALLRSQISKEANLSYKSSQGAYSLIDKLPSGPEWSLQTLTVDGYETAEPIILYKRNSEECVEYLFNNPLFADCMNYVPVKHYTADGKRVLTEPISGQAAWDIQTKLPQGATRLGIGLASDATLLTSGTGDLEAHPLMMTLDNISSATRRKSSNHAYILIALLPKVNFLVRDGHVQRALRDQIFHDCLRIVLEPLRRIAREGKYMSDPLGQNRLCFTVLSMYMVDLPEATKLAGVTTNCSPVSVATSTEFGENTPAHRRWFRITKGMLRNIAELRPPERDFYAFVKLAHKNRLTGVQHLIWDDWDHAEPPIALCYDLLHSGHKFWYDHPLKWCIAALGNEEIDFRYKCLHARKGWKHFAKGVASIKKITGRDYRNMQRHIMCVLDGAAPPGFTALIRAHLDYHYISQKPEITFDDLEAIKRLQGVFHSLKSILHTRHYRRVPGFKIPKLELQMGIIFTIAFLGNLLGLSTDITEHEHIMLVKEPFRRTNHKNFRIQMVAFLSRMERLRHFDLATALLVSNDLEELNPSSFYNNSDENRFLDRLASVQNLRGAKRAEFTDYFELYKKNIHLVRSAAEKSRFRTFIASPFTAVHLNREPSLPETSIAEISRRFDIPDLYDRIRDFFNGHTISEDAGTSTAHIPVLGGLGNQNGTPENRIREQLDFDTLRIWFTMKIQTRSLLQPGTTNKPATICAAPPVMVDTAPNNIEDDSGGAAQSDSDLNWILGRYDFALFVNDMSKEFAGHATLHDHCIGQIRLIFQPVSRTRTNEPYLVYAQRLDPLHRSRLADPSTGLTKLHRAMRSPTERLGAVAEASRIRCAVDVQPFFGQGKADKRLSFTTSTEISSYLNLNKYSDKETFALLHV